jgi:hypothetical protein
MNNPDATEPIYLRHLVTITASLIQTGDYTHAGGGECGMRHNEAGACLVTEAAEEILLDLILNAKSLAKFEYDERRKL